MIVTSTTLVGASREIVAAAILSVLPFVDQCLLVDTGANDESIEVAAETAGSKAVVEAFPWRDDFAAARNFALARASELGGDWAVTVDADERLLTGGLDVRGALARTDAGCLLVPDRSGTYVKERFFRLPCPIRFSGPTHEAFPAYQVGAQVMDLIKFEELPKSQEQTNAKRLRDVRILTTHLKDNAQDPRWWYYLGDALQGVGRLGEAIHAYGRCEQLNGWDEEAAWACYRAAECEVERGDLQAALSWCTRGQFHHAGLAELPWLAGVCCYRLGRFRDAVAWARQSEALGLAAGIGADMERIGFRHVPALHEGPYDILRFALMRLGHPEAAADAEHAYEDARAGRIGSTDT